MDYIFRPHPISSLEISASQQRFPIRRIYCIGRNYADHAREMGAHDQAEGREPPFFFSKPADAVISTQDVPYPTATANLQHEVELVLALGDETRHLGKMGSDIPIEDALHSVLAYAVGLDLTRRDLQAQAKAKGHPWDMAKGFDASAPVGTLQLATLIGHPESGRIWLKVNGELRQEGNLSDMTWRCAEIIAQLSRLVRLAPGDLIFTGTPAGVSTVKPGDILHAGIEGVGDMSVRLV